MLYFCYNVSAQNFYHNTLNISFLISYKSVFKSRVYYPISIVEHSPSVTFRTCILCHLHPISFKACQIVPSSSVGRPALCIASCGGLHSNGLIQLSSITMDVCQPQFFCKDNMLILRLRQRMSSLNIFLSKCSSR